MNALTNTISSIDFERSLLYGGPKKWNFGSIAKKKAMITIVARHSWTKKVSLLITNLASHTTPQSAVIGL